MLDMHPRRLTAGPNPVVDRVVVISDDSVHSGGAAAIALSSVQLLCKHGVAVTLLTGDSGQNRDLVAAGCEIVALGKQHLLEGSRIASAVRGVYDPRVSAFLGDWIAHHDTPATVYHLHNWHKYLSPAVFTALAPVVERLVMTLHDYFLVCPNGSFAHFPRGRPCDLEPMTARCLCSACDKRHYGHKLWRVARHLTRQAVIDLATTRATLVAVHGASLDLMRRGGVSADRIRVLHNPVEPWCLQRVEAERNHEVFFVGRLEKDKGADVLVRACERLGANVTLIGSGPLGPVLEGRRGTRLLGQRTRSEIAGLVRAARMLVIPSRWRETFGLVALEAAMSGIPVIVSDLVPFSADLQRIGAGVVWRSSDEVSLETEISRLASDDAAIGEMSRRGFTEARSLAPTPDAWCTALLALYSDVLGAGRAGVETERVPRCAMYDR